MSWTVLYAEEFKPEFDRLPEKVRKAIRAKITLLEREGPELGRPRVDTLKGSKYANMKELRSDAAGGVWRLAFAFDPERRAILLVAGDKSGGNERRFYQRLLALADKRFANHLNKRGG